MKPFLILALLLLFALPAIAQQRWEKTYGGPFNEGGLSVRQTADGGYVVTGETNSYGAGNWDVYLIKTNASGDTLWTRTYGGSGDDAGESIQQTRDGGFILAGYSNSFGMGPHVYLIKTNPSGDTLWCRTFGGGGYEGGHSVQQTADGGYILAGYTTSFGSAYQVYLVKTDTAGDTLWTRTYGGTTIDWGYSVQQTTDGGYIVAGWTDSFGNDLQVYLIKTDSLGDTLWTRTYGGTTTEWGHSVQQTKDGGYIVAGYTTSFGNAYQAYLVKTDALGDTLWTRTYGGANYDYGWSVQQTADTGYVIGGMTDSFGNSEQVYLIKINAFGDTLWTRTYGGASIDEGWAVQQTADGGYIIAGNTNSFGNGYQVYLIKTNANGNVGGGSQSRESQVTGYEVFPNPFVSFATIPGHEAERFAVYDIAGRKVGTYRGDRVGEGLAPGVYFLRSSDGKDRPLRVVKVR